MDPHNIKCLSPKILEVKVKSSFDSSEFLKLDAVTVIINMRDLVEGEDGDVILPKCTDLITRKMKAVDENYDLSIDYILG